MKKVVRVLEMEKEYENNIFGYSIRIGIQSYELLLLSDMPVFCNLSMATLSSQSNVATTEASQACASTLRATFGSLADLRKYHSAHGKPKVGTRSKSGKGSDFILEKKMASFLGRI